MLRRNFLGTGLAAAGSLLAAPVADLSAQPVPAAPPSPSLLVHPGARGTDELVAEAKQNIERHRKQDISLRLLRGDGQPLANTRINLVQQRQDFPFGDCNWGMNAMFQEGQTNQPIMRFTKLVQEEVLNAVNITCYWTERHRYGAARMEDEQGRIDLNAFDYTLDWASSRGMICKGHPIFWPVDKAVPQWLQRYDYPTQLKFLEVHVRSLVARYKGRITVWDAVNEMMWEPALKNLAQRNWPHIEPIPVIADYVGHIIRWAREEDPAAQFLINEYGIEADEKKDLKTKDSQPVTAESQRRRYLELVKALKEAGAAPNALGMQCHSGGWQQPGAQLAFYDQMATAGLPLHVTEFWAHTDHLKKSGMKLVADNGDFHQEPIKPKKDQKIYSKAEIDQLQSDFVVQYLTCAYGHPAIQAFFFWNYLGIAADWKDSGYDPKPTYHALKKLIREDWMTRTTATTDSEGRLRFRGFTGSYQALYPVAGGQQQAAVPFQLVKQAKAQEVELVAGLG